MRERGVEFVWLQRLAVECANTEGDRVVQLLLWRGQAKLFQFLREPLPAVLAAAQCSPLAAQSASSAQVAGVLRADQHAHVEKLASLAHRVADGAGANVEAKD
jgi:hypothetical protein